MKTLRRPQHYSAFSTLSRDKWKKVMKGWGHPEVYRKGFLYLILGFVFGSFVIGFNFQSNFQKLRYLSNYSSSSLSVNYSEYIVHTRTCSIPHFDPRDPEIRKFIDDKVKPFSCGLPALTSISNRRLIINVQNLTQFGGKTLNDVQCCLQVVTRGQGDYCVIISPNCSRVENGTFVTAEFVRVNCTVNETKSVVEYHFTIPPPQHTIHNVTGIPNGKYPLNVMVIGLDSVSRLNFERNLPKTRKYLLESMGAVEMFGYTKVGDNTLPNLAPLFGGLSKRKLLAGCAMGKWTLDDCTSWIWRKFSQMGYRTLYGEDTYEISSFNTEMRGFVDQPTDHYLRPLFIAADELANRTDIDTRLCMGPTPMHQVTLDYGVQFVKVMRDVPYFGIVWSNSLTHEDGDSVQLADDYLLQNLVKLHTDGYLKRTVVFIVSDHGRRYGYIRRTIIGSYENRLPALFVYLPEEFREDKRNFYENLMINSRRVTSPFDVYRTFLHILRLSTNFSAKYDEGLSSHGMSLLEPVPKDRTCNDAGIHSEWCACDDSVDLDVRDSLVVSIARFVVQWINDAMKDVMDKCAFLTLKTVNKASIQTNVDLLCGEYQDDRQYYYRVMMTVEPSNAVFEATVKSTDDTKGDKTLDSDVTRLNKYGKQSHCVHDVTLKPFCYCLNQTL